MNSTDENIISDYYDNYKETQAEIFKIETRKARNMIFTVAAVLLIGDLLGLAIANAITYLTLLAALLFPVVFTGLGFFARKQPLLAVILSMIVFAIIIILTFFVMGSVSLISGLVVKAIIVFCLIAGLNNAREAERAKKEMQ